MHSPTEGLALANAVSVDEVYALEELFQKLSNSLHHVRPLRMAIWFHCGWLLAFLLCYASNCWTCTYI